MGKGVKGFFADIAKAPIAEAGKVVDNLHTSQDERSEKLNERLNIDTKGSWLSKNIRPIICIWIMTILTLSAYNVIKPEIWFQETIKQSFTLVISFYFAERGLRYLVRSLKSK